MPRRPPEPVDPGALHSYGDWQRLGYQVQAGRRHIARRNPDGQIVMGYQPDRPGTPLFATTQVRPAGEERNEMPRPPPRGPVPAGTGTRPAARGEYQQRQQRVVRGDGLFPYPEVTVMPAPPPTPDTPTAPATPLRHPDPWAARWATTSVSSHQFTSRDYQQFVYGDGLQPLEGTISPVEQAMQPALDEVRRAPGIEAMLDQMAQERARAAQERELVRRRELEARLRRDRDGYGGWGTPQPPEKRPPRLVADYAPQEELTGFQKLAAMEKMMKDGISKE